MDCTTSQDYVNENLNELKHLSLNTSDEPDVNVNSNAIVTVTRTFNALFNNDDINDESNIMDQLLSLIHI